MGRPPCCDKSNVKRGNWTAEEDAKLLAYVSMHGTGNWTSVPKKAGLKRCGKSCRLRWTNYLRPDLKRENFIPQEEELIIKLHETFGSRWSLIAGQLPGRTDNDVKNYWNTKLRKKLFDIGIDPVTHKPFSQIFADYGKIGGLLNKSSRFGSLNRDLRDAFVPKSSELVSNTQEPILDHSMSMIRTMPKMEPIQDIPLNDNNNSWGLLAQIHAIQLMSDQNQNQFQQPAYLFHEGSCSSSSVSSSNFSQITSPPQPQPQPQPPSPSTFQPLPSQQPSLNQNSSSSSFSWSEFLLDNEMLLPSDQQAEENVELSTFSSSGSSIQGQDEFKTNKDGDGHDVCYGAEEMGCVQACNDSVMRLGSAEVTIAGTSSSSSISDNFIEGILDQDSEMSMWAFPNLFDEPSY